MIDYDFEDWLVDRIAVREAIAARLSPRQRHVLSRCYHYGETYREVAVRDGVSTTRINQIHDQSIRVLRAHFAKPDRTAPTTRNTPPAGFDKAAFLRHMQWLIGHRATQEAEVFARERDVLERALGINQPKSKPKPVYHDDLSPPRPPPPTTAKLSDIAHSALRYLLLMRPQYFAGTPWLGKWCTSVVFPIEGGVTTVAVDNLNKEIPHHARLSAFPVAIPDGTTGANATTPYASLRVTVTPDGLKLRFDVTWD